jgi:hypothetical protein
MVLRVPGRADFFRITLTPGRFEFLSFDGRQKKTQSTTGLSVAFTVRSSAGPIVGHSVASHLNPTDCQ